MASIETEKKETDLTNNENNDVEIVAEEPKKLDLSEGFNAKVIVVTSGKGGVGKTTSSAAISSGIALAGHKTVVIDFDVGLRNLDLVMGCERRVVYDFVNVIKEEATLNQALIKDKNSSNLYIHMAPEAHMVVRHASQ